MSRILSELLDAGAPLDEVERLVARWGGLPLSVPRSPSPTHPITTCAGPNVARELSRMFGGERVNMPLGAALLAEQRRRKVAALKQAGLNHTEIARRLGLHLRYVQRTIQRLRAEPLPLSTRKEA